MVQPATLEQRGTYVPFTTPLLSLGRVRTDERQDLVLVLSPLDDGEGAYIVPWKALPDLGSMSVHDRVLSEIIDERRAVTPPLMRECVLETARTGLAGPGAAIAARKAVALEQRAALQTQFAMIASLLMALEFDISGLLALDPGGDAWQQPARELLSGMGERLGMTASRFYARSAALARVIAPLGFAKGMDFGRFRRLLSDLTSLAESFQCWGEAERSGIGDCAIEAAELASQTALLADGIVAQFDKRTEDPRWMLVDWQREATMISAISNRLSWLLDGWDYIVAIWGHVLNEKIVAQRETMVQLMPALPLIPMSEVGALSEMPTIPSLPPALGRVRRGQIDIDMVARLELSKAWDGSK